MISIPLVFHGDDRLLDVFAHEFFHCWNVKRIRPKTLEPFNFEKSDMSFELWFAEGFTQYYGSLLVERAGFGKDTDYVKHTVAGLINTKVNTPGAKGYSPIEASEDAVFTYYPYGGSLALALDLTLRAKYNKTLDDYMTAVWKRFGKPEIPYNVAGLQEVLVTVTDKKFADTWFANYIYGHEPIDYNALLAPAGFLLKPTEEGKAWIGSTRGMSEKEGLILENGTLRGTPLYAAGVDVDDKIIALDNQDVRTLADLNTVLGRLHSGATVAIRYMHRNVEKSSTITLAENPAVSVVTFEQAGKPITSAIQEFRQHWLGAK
jgi:predicted metalloprotease with PDZ domain